MFKLFSVSILIALGVCVAYLLMWPVNIQPISWNAPVDKGYTAPFTPNMKLAELKSLSIGDLHGPEDVVGRKENGEWIVYTSTQSGDILRINTNSKEHTVFADTQGVPLGLAFDATGNLIVADAHRGLLSIDNSGQVSVLTTTTDDGAPIVYADELDIAKDGKIYFSDASTKFSAQDNGGTLEASLLEIMEHGSTGRVLVFDPSENSTRILADNLSFPNGIAMCPDDQCILVAETGTYSIKRYWLSGVKSGLMDTIIDNLPGFPDNINRGLDGRYWIGLTSPRSKPLDKYSTNPTMRKIMMRLPAFLRPSAESYGFVFAIDFNGNFIAQYQDPSASYPLTTGATEIGDGWLYISSLGSTWLGRKSLRHELFAP